MPVRTLSVPALGLALVTASCCSTPSEHPEPAAAHAAGKSTSGSEDTALRLEWARIEARVAELSADLQRGRAERDLVEANEKLEQARAELEAFESHELPNRLADAHLDMDYTVQRRDEARAELAELEAMYAAEEFAEATKELVLQRGRKQLEFAERRLELQARRLEHLERRELPLERQKKLSAVAEAEHELRLTQLEMERTELEASLAVEKAHKEVRDLEKESASARS